jgi:hypothetical protein
MKPGDCILIWTLVDVQDNPMYVAVTADDVAEDGGEHPEPEQQVDRDVLKPLVKTILKSDQRLFGRMGAVQELEVGFRKRLHPYAQPVDRGLFQLFQVRWRAIIRINFKGNF